MLEQPSESFISDTNLESTLFTDQIITSNSDIRKEKQDQNPRNFLIDGFVAFEAIHDADDLQNERGQQKNPDHKSSFLGITGRSFNHTL